MTQPVLIVEDHDDARHVVERFLQHGGYAVTTAINGKDALDQIGHGLRPCLILLDVMMPVMDGPTFAERLRALPDRALAETPIVLLTGAFETQAALERSHAVEVIRKPVSFQRVVDVVGRHCRT
jgi:two-component system, chemotaxis family, chemotaxis protein CheY